MGTTMTFILRPGISADATAYMRVMGIVSGSDLVHTFHRVLGEALPSLAFTLNIATPTFPVALGTASNQAVSVSFTTATPFSSMPMQHDTNARYSAALAAALGVQLSQITN